MDEYDEANKEIQNFLARRRGEERDREDGPDAHASRQRDRSARRDHEILPLLQSLNRTYGEINEYLKTGNSEALKDVILKSDIKMSMVCETLLDTLRQCTEDKNRLQKENERVEEKRRSAEESEVHGRIARERAEEEARRERSHAAELERIVRDQKERMAEHRAEAARLKSETGFQKSRIEEIESLRDKAAQRLVVYEREMEAVKALLKEKDESLKRAELGVKEEANKNSGAKSRVVELERMLEVLNSKLEMRDKNLALCNTELSRVIVENKAMKGDYERYKEGSAYYEGLYKNLNKQNAYLNEQLNRMLRSGEYNKEGMAIFEEYSRGLKKAKRKIRRLRDERERLKSQLKEEPNESNREEDDTLATRIEELEEENKTQRARIEQLLRDRRETAHKPDANHKPGSSITGYKPGSSITGYKPGSSITGYKPANPIPMSYKLVDARPGEYKQASTRGPSEHNQTPSIATQPTWRGFTDTPRALPAETRPSGLTDSRAPYQPARTPYQPAPPRPFGELFSSPSTLPPLMPELRQSKFESQRPKEETPVYPKPVLENDYGDLSAGVPGGFTNATLHGSSGIRATPGLFEGAVPAAPAPTTPVAPLAPPSLSTAASLTTTGKPPVVGPGGPTASASRRSGQGQRRAATRQGEEEQSTESVRTYHTTSTLKDMIAKTETLQKRFENLEKQLEEIDEGDSEEKLREKLKTYNSHFSELNANSEESEFI